MIKEKGHELIGRPDHSLYCRLCEGVYSCALNDMPPCLGPPVLRDEVHNGVKIAVDRWRCTKCGTTLAALSNMYGCPGSKSFAAAPPTASPIGNSVGDAVPAGSSLITGLRIGEAGQTVLAVTLTANDIVTLLGGVKLHANVSRSLAISIDMKSNLPEKNG